MGRKGGREREKRKSERERENLGFIVGIILIKRIMVLFRGSEKKSIPSSGS